MTTTRSPGFRWIMGLVILSSCIGCDQVTKNIATQTLRNAPPQRYLGDTIRLEFALNAGGFLSFGNQFPKAVRPWVFIGFSSCLMLAVAVLLVVRRDMPWSQFVALTCILAGGIGNLIDRVTNNGLVTDFINVGIGPLRSGIFNVADMAITFGGIAVVILALRSEGADPLRPPNPAS